MVVRTTTNYFSVGLFCLHTLRQRQFTSQAINLCKCPISDSWQFLHGQDNCYKSTVTSSQRQGCCWTINLSKQVQCVVLGMRQHHRKIFSGVCDNLLGKDILKFQISGSQAMPQHRYEQQQGLDVRCMVITFALHAPLKYFSLDL